MATPIVASRAVSYIRMSTDEQADSPAQQRAEIAKLANKLGVTIGQEYIDEGISGAESTKRKGFQQLISDAQAKRFDLLLLWDQDRLSRFDPIEANYYWHILRTAGVRIHTVAQGELDLETLGGWLTASVQQYGKAQYLRDLSRNALRGLATKAKAGKSTGGKPPYGYRAGWIIDPATAPVVRRIFEEFTAGGSLLGVAHRLTADGVLSPRGKAWRNNTILQILGRRAYTGMYVWNERPQGKFHSLTAAGIESRNGHRPVAEPIVLADHHTPIIDRVTFDLAQQRLGFNRRQTSPHNRTGGGYLLTGLLRCGCCGSSMCGQRGCRYECSGYHAGGRAKCSRNAIDEAPLVGAIVRKIRHEYLAPERLDELRAEIRRQQQTEHKPVDTAKLEKRLAALNKQVETAADRILSAPQSIASTLYSRLEAMQTERDELRQQLDAASKAQTASGDKGVQEAEAAIDALWRLSDAITAAEGDDLRRLLQAAVERIELFFRAGTDGKPQFASGMVHFAGFQLVHLAGAR